MAERKINPILKQVLELGPTLVFFLIYMRIKDETYTLGGTDYSGFIVAALVLVPLLLAAIFALWLLTGTISRMQIFVAVMVVVFGGVGNLWGTLVGAMSLGILNKFLEPYAGAVLGKILVLVLIILFIQKRPRGLFALKGRAVEA